MTGSGKRRIDRCKRSAGIHGEGQVGARVIHHLIHSRQGENDVEPTRRVTLLEPRPEARRHDGQAVT